MIRITLIRSTLIKNSVTKKIWSTTLLALPLLLSSNLAFSQEEDETHNFIQLNYVAESPHESDINPTGVGLLMRYEFLEQAFIRVELEDLSDKDVDVAASSLALAYVFNPHSATAYHVAALFEHEDEKEGDEEQHSFAKGIELGFHTELNHQFTLHGELAVVNENNEETIGAELGLFFKFVESFGINIEFGVDEDKNSAIEIGLRYSFH